VSQRTIQRRLAEENLIARRAVRKPRLTKAMKTSVYNGPENTVEDWNKVNMINLINNSIMTMNYILCIFAALLLR